jgi:sialic acid synthase SpsE
MGAMVVEKHFTVNKKLKKSADHWLSVNEKELKKIAS